MVLLTYKGASKSFDKPVTVADIHAFFKDSTGHDAKPELEPVDLIGLNSGCAWGSIEFYQGVIGYRSW